MPQIGQVTISELLTALRAGWYDFRAAPEFGLFFSAIYVLGGIALVFLGAGATIRVLAVSLGFPLVAPFAAVGLYSVSRRLEAGEPLVWREILRDSTRRRNLQISRLGAIMVIFLLAWWLLAGLIYSTVTGSSAPGSFAAVGGSYLNLRGLILLVSELAVGGAVAFLLFSMSVVSMPLLLDRDTDFASAVRLSLATVRRNPVTMLIWATIIAVLLLLAMLPVFLGLFVVLPVLGHATWHLYRRALYDVM